MTMVTMTMPLFLILMMSNGDDDVYDDDDAYAYDNAGGYVEEYADSCHVAYKLFTAAADCYYVVVGDLMRMLMMDILIVVMMRMTMITNI